MAGKDFGGRMTVRLATGELLAMRGNFSVEGADQSNEPQENQDGSTDRIGKPESPTIEATFKDDGIRFENVMKAPRQNITVFEEFTGVTHYLFNAFFAGKPKSDRLKGEVSGLTMVGETYRRTES